MSTTLLVRVSRRFIFTEAMQPMGLLYVASTLRQAHPQRSIHLVDLRTRRDHRPRSLVPDLERLRPHIVGISACTCEAAETHATARVVKELSPGTTVVVGGPYATAAPAAVLDDPHVDFVVVGEGELTARELWEALERDTPVDGIRGIAYRRRGQVVLEPPRPFIQDLDSLPFPAWDLLDLEAYFRIPRMVELYAHRRYMAVVSSRGCPYGCVFCHNIFGKRFRARSPHNVLQELSYLSHHLGIREFHFIDDVFNLDRRRVIQLCDLIVEHGLKVRITFPNALRGDIMDEEVIAKLKRAGTFRINYALETGSPRLQRLIGKNLNLTRLREAIELTDRHGIMSGCTVMLGFPTETEEEMRATLDFALRSKLHTWFVFFVSPQPQTPLWALLTDEQRQQVLRSHMNDYLVPHYHNGLVSPRRMVQMVLWARLRFWANPWRVVRFLQLVPSWAALMHTVWGMPKVLWVMATELLRALRSGRRGAAPHRHAPSPSPPRVPEEPRRVSAQPEPLPSHPHTPLARHQRPSTDFT